MIKGRTIVRDPALKRARALMMLEYKIKNGATAEQIAQEFGVSRETVNRTMSYARKAELLVNFEDKILNELMPEAHEAIKRLLQDTENPVESAKLALELMKGFLPSLNKKQLTGPSGDSDELGRYIEQFRSGHGVLDGEVADGSAQRALPPGPKEAPSEPNAAPGDILSRVLIEPALEESVGEVGIERSESDSEG